MGTNGSTFLHYKNQASFVSFIDEGEKKKVHDLENVVVFQIIKFHWAKTKKRHLPIGMKAEF